MIGFEKRGVMAQTINSELTIPWAPAGSLQLVRTRSQIIYSTVKVSKNSVLDC